MRGCRRLAAVVCLALAGAGIGVSAEPEGAGDVAPVVAAIDAALAASWTAQELTPADPAGDAEFLRRVTLDLTGVIPTQHEVRTFLADESPEKRARLIDALLIRPAHARHRARLWRDAWIPREARSQQDLETPRFEGWLVQRFAARTTRVEGTIETAPADAARYDATVRELLTHTGESSEPVPTLFFTSRGLQPDRLAADVSRTLLGLPLECARCHDHDDRTPADFWGLAALFARTVQPQMKRFPWQLEDAFRGEVQIPGRGVDAVPRLPGADAPLSELAGPRRQQLATWLVQADNPYFARTAVQAVWEQLFGRRLVPFGDSTSVPAAHREILNLLARDFTEHDHDLRRVYRILPRTRAYQLSSADATSAPRASFARMVPKRMTPDQLHDSVLEAARRNEADYFFAAGPFVTYHQERREFLARWHALDQQRDDPDDLLPPLPAVGSHLLRGASTLSKSDLVAVLRTAPFLSDHDRIDALYLATLSRPPTEEERLRGVADLQPLATKPRDQALLEVFHGLVNSAEFSINH